MQRPVLQQRTAQGCWGLSPAQEAPHPLLQPTGGFPAHAFGFSCYQNVICAESFITKRWEITPRAGGAGGWSSAAEP